MAAKKNTKENHAYTVTYVIYTINPMTGKDQELIFDDLGKVQSFVRKHAKVTGDRLMIYTRRRRVK